jgi:hypothetical protein
LEVLDLTVWVTRPVLVFVEVVKVNVVAGAVVVAPPPAGMKEIVDLVSVAAGKPFTVVTRVPTTPAVKFPLVGPVKTGAELTVIESDADCANPPTVSVARTVKVYLPPRVGVPEMAPVEGSSDRPGGKAPENTEKDRAPVPPLAVKGSGLYRLFTRTTGRVGELIVTAGFTVSVYC